MDIKQLTTTLQGDFAGQAMAVIADYCVTCQKNVALKKFQEFSAELLQTFTEGEQEELRDLIEKMIQTRATKMADTLAKTIPQEQLDQIVSDGNQSLA